MVQREIQWNLYKADSLSSGHLFKTDSLSRNRWIYSETLMKKSLKADNYKADNRKTDTFFVPQMNSLPKNNLYKADRGTKTIFT